MTAANSFNAEEILEGILEWVSIESPTYDRDAVNRMMDAAIETVQPLGARIERVPGRDGYGDVVKATIEGESDDPGLLVLGHLDTVHLVGTLAGPLPIRREGDKVYGPGILDMKGGPYRLLNEEAKQTGTGGRIIQGVVRSAIGNQCRHVIGKSGMGDDGTQIIGP